MDHPPKPRFALTVGVTGHRPNRLPERAHAHVEAAIADALGAIKRAALAAHARHAQFFSQQDPILALAGALAEGADTMAAKAGTAAGYALDVVLPFSVEEYAKDFSPSAVATFRELCTTARAVLKLGGTRADEGKSYEAAGLVMLDQSDILITVWDGGTSAGRGGTPEITAEAARRGMPILHIDSEGTRPVRLIWPGLSGGRLSSHIADHPNIGLDEQMTSAVVDALVRPPRDEEQLDGLHRFWRARAHRLNWRQSFPLLLGVFGVRAPTRTDLRPAVPQSLSVAVKSADPTAPSILAESYAWADAIGVYFAQMFRGAYVDNFLLSALAVFLAAFALVTEGRLTRVGLGLAELILIFWILANTHIGVTQHWRQLWVEAREVAERLRLALPMSMLGTYSFLPYGETKAWTSWYVRAVSRDAGLRSGDLDAAGLNAVRTALDLLVRDQSDYQHKVALQFARLNRRMTIAGEVFFYATLVMIALHVGLLLAKAELGPVVEHLLMALSTALPAMAAAMYGIRLIGDFAGTSTRAKRMHDELESLPKIPAGANWDFHQSRARAHLIAETMLGDVASWRISAESRNLSLPG